MPVGMWVIRTAESVVLTLCPPGPEERKTSTRISFSGMSTWSVCSTTGSTSTPAKDVWRRPWRSEEHTSELQSHSDIVCRLLLEKNKRQLGGLPDQAGGALARRLGGPGRVREAHLRPPGCPRDRALAPR